ncbi:MAG: diguanylate cyclase domain-containing protein, partial [Silanimonas sp.]
SGDSTLWVRVDSRGTLTVPLTLWQPEAFATHNQALYAVHAGYFGLLLGLAVFYLLLGLGLRDGVFLTYAIYGLCLGIGLAAQNGFGGEYLWRDWPALSNLALPLGMQASTGFGAWFVLRFLDLRARGGAVAWGLRALMFSCFAVGMPALLLDLRWSWPLVSINALLFCGVALAASVSALRRRVPAALPFLLAWLMLLAGALLTGLRNLGIVPTNAWTANALQIGSSLEMLLLAIALAARFAALRTAHADSQAQLIAMKQQALELATRAEATLEARVDERTAELAEANRRLREREVQLRAMANRDVLTGAANRVALRQALEAQLDDWNRGGAPFAVLLLDLDGFKPVNDRHGHAVGDDVLVEISRRLCQAVRAGDLVARHGGDEFVLLLRNLLEDAALEQRVRELAEAVQAPILIGEESAVVKASIGVARAATSADTVDGLLRRADLAMYAAKAQGSGRWSYAPAVAG